MVKKCLKCTTYIPDGNTYCSDKCAEWAAAGEVARRTEQDNLEYLASVRTAAYQPLKVNGAPRPEPRTTLPLDSEERKEYPLVRGCLNYFPAALAGVAHLSKLGNDKHNPGQELHHSRGKSSDHADCILRHMLDLQELLASQRASPLTPEGQEQVLMEASSLAWRALALSQELHEQFGAPLAPGAKIDKPS